MSREEGGWPGGSWHRGCSRLGPAQRLPLAGRAGREPGAGAGPGAGSCTGRDRHLPSGHSGLSHAPGPIRDSSLHPGKREPQPLAAGTAQAYRGSPGVQKPLRDGTAPSSITSMLPFFLLRAVWGHKHRDLCLLPARAADAITAGTAAALTSWLPARGGLCLPRDPKPQWWPTAPRSRGKADSSWLEEAAAQGRAEPAHHPATPWPGHRDTSGCNCALPMHGCGNTTASQPPGTFPAGAQQSCCWQFQAGWVC